MKKRIISIAVAVLLLCNAFAIPVAAQERTEPINRFVVQGWYNYNCLTLDLNFRLLDCNLESYMLAFYYVIK